MTALTTYLTSKDTEARLQEQPATEMAQRQTGQSADLELDPTTTSMHSRSAMASASLRIRSRPIRLRRMLYRN